MMTCMILVEAPDSSTVKARALLDSASSASFVSERLIKGICLSCAHQNTTICGIAGLTHNSLQAIANLTVSSAQTGRKFNFTTVAVPRVTCDLPIQPVPFSSNWNHLVLQTQTLGNLGGSISTLVWKSLPKHCYWASGQDHQVPQSRSKLCLDGYSQVQPINSHQKLASPLFIFWLLLEMICYESSGKLRRVQNTNLTCPQKKGSLCNTSKRITVVLLSGDSLIHYPSGLHPLVSCSLMQSERSLHAKDEYEAFDSVMQEYFVLKHAEPVTTMDLNAPPSHMFYLPMHAVKKETSRTTKIRAVFDASAKSSSNVSLNDILLVGHTVHSSLNDVLLCFRCYRIALTADVRCISDRTGGIWSRRVPFCMAKWPRQTPPGLS